MRAQASPLLRLVFGLALEDRLQEVVERPSSGGKPTKPIKTDGIASRTSGSGHHRRRLVRVDVRGVEARLAEEDEEDEPEHVERGQEGGGQADDRDELAQSASR